MLRGRVFDDLNRFLPVEQSAAVQGPSSCIGQQALELFSNSLTGQRAFMSCILRKPFTATRLNLLAIHNKLLNFRHEMRVLNAAKMGGILKKGLGRCCC
jgi:hypothetical protein